MMIIDKIKAELLRRLDEGVYPPGSKFPSEVMLADEFEVNKTTISKVVSIFAEQGRLIRGVRGAGTHVAESLFRPRGAIAFLVKLGRYSLEMLHGIQSECLHNGYFPIVFSPEVAELPYALDMLHRKNVAGIISMGYGIIEPREGIELVCLDYARPQSYSGRPFRLINSDNFLGGRLMIDEVIRRGHRDIVLFSSERFVYGNDAPVPERVMGFHQAMKKNAITDYADRTFYGAPESLDDALAGLKKIGAFFPHASIICTDSDGSAELIYRAAKKLRIPCLDDIALTGFGNVTSLPIASVDQNPRRQGELAVRMLIALDCGETDVPESELVTPSLTGVEYIPIRLG